MALTNIQFPAHVMWFAIGVTCDLIQTRNWVSVTVQLSRHDAKITQKLCVMQKQTVDSSTKRKPSFHGNPLGWWHTMKHSEKSINRRSMSWSTPGEQKRIRKNAVAKKPWNRIRLKLWLYSFPTLKMIIFPNKGRLLIFPSLIRKNVFWNWRPSQTRKRIRRGRILQRFPAVLDETDLQGLRSYV